ncbi:SRPBCC family protein [Ornithinimicrobium sp. F0845]|uniref:SRPBCC family protein n=1 Tax=Ornithinimicrobium sp. F0845 TaxID=2926412 RepID=UPI001FF4D72B|nr:SRPBCC family protein [Ornithinimicrobium sp. F0845]MCK0112506.1 SRPBCC family protein [Ornithinimicrobium sp. F0845]
MGQILTTDTVERVINASPGALYDIVSDVTRMPELSPEIRSCRWVRGATGPVVGARFRAINTLGGPITWPNWPVVLVADHGREFTISRTEPLFGTLEWRYRFVPEGDGTRVIETYAVTKPLTSTAYLLLRLFGDADRAATLRQGMATTLERLAVVAERQVPTPPAQEV